MCLFIEFVKNDDEDNFNENHNEDFNDQDQDVNDQYNDNPHGFDGIGQCNGINAKCKYHSYRLCHGCGKVFKNKKGREQHNNRYKGSCKRNIPDGCKKKNILIVFDKYGLKDNIRIGSE